MNCSCSICCSRLDSSDDIFSTSCGHIFHFPCLTQWLERSKTCPQCREKTNVSKIHRLYFNISNNDTIKEDSSTLQERIDNLKFQILLRDKDVTDLKNKADKLQMQMKGLRSKVLKLETEIEHKNSAIHALKEQTKYYKYTYDEFKQYKVLVETMKKELNDYKDIQSLLSSANDEAEVLISNTDDSRKLATYVSVLKRELTVGLNNRKEYRMMIKQLKQDLNKKILENNTLKESVNKIKIMEETIERLENENLSLMNAVENQNKLNCTETETDDLLNNKSLTVSKNKIFKSKLDIKLSMDGKSSEENEENSPSNCRFKVQDLVGDSKRKYTRSNSRNVASNSILAKKPRLSHDLMASAGSRDDMYATDGLGGFSKIENFPKIVVSGGGGGVKKKVMSGVKTRKKNEMVNQNKIDYFVDLTAENNLK